MKLCAVAVLISLAGCIGGSKKPGYIAGGAVAAIGVVLMRSTQERDCTSMGSDAIPCGADELGAMMLGSAALLAGLGIVTLTAVIPAPEPDPEPPIAPAVLAEAQTLPVMAPQAAEDMLRELTVQAGVAARGGRCVSVVVIAQRVDQLDRAYRHGGFVADPLVAACLR